MILGVSVTRFTQNRLSGSDTLTNKIIRTRTIYLQLRPGLLTPTLIDFAVLNKASFVSASLSLTETYSLSSLF